MQVPTYNESESGPADHVVNGCNWQSPRHTSCDWLRRLDRILRQNLHKRTGTYD